MLFIITLVDNTYTVLLTTLRVKYFSKVGEKAWYKAVLQLPCDKKQLSNYEEGAKSEKTHILWQGAAYQARASFRFLLCICCLGEAIDEATYSALRKQPSHIAQPTTREVQS